VGSDTNPRQMVSELGRIVGHPAGGAELLGCVLKKHTDWNWDQNCVCARMLGCVVLIALCFNMYLFYFY